jgi:hypothetical protein
MFVQQGEWIVYTPIYAGTADEVAKAAKCPHATYIEVSKTDQDGWTMVLDRCSACIAVRTKAKRSVDQ